MNGARAQTVLYLLTALVLAVCLSILVWLRGRYEHDRGESLRRLQSLFTRDEVLKPPQDINLRFGDIESLARKFEASLFVRRVYVVKNLETGGEHVVRPFYLPAIEPDWRARLAETATRLPLEAGGEEYGALYVEESTEALRTVQWAIGGLGVMLVLTLGLLTARLGVQQTELAGARVALAEKDRQLIRLERLALAGQLSANVIHDIKKPVTNIKHSLDDLSDALRDVAGGSPALRNIREQTQLFFSILSELGFERFVSADDSRAEYVDIHEAMRRSIVLARYERGAVELETDFDDSLTPLALAPPYRLIQVFSNLILNAYQAMNGRGRLTLRTRARDGRLFVEIVDTGPGVSADMRARLFQPFESSKPEGKGSGLGLYISRNIVKGLGGDLRLADDGGAGARFVVEIPLSAV